MNNSLISIIVPVYNVEKYLDRCIMSLVNQSYSNLEIILVNDGSTDYSLNVCEKWKSRDDRIILINKENGGLSDARNAALEIVKGEYVSFVDSDDYISPVFIEKLYESIVLSQSDLCQCDFKKVKETESVDNSLMSFNYVIETFDKITALEFLIKGKKINQVVWNKLYKKCLFDNLRFEYGKLNEDDFFTYQVLSRCSKVSYINIPLYYYLIREGSIMGTQYSIRRLDGLEARFCRYNFIKENYFNLASLDKKSFIFFALYCYQKVITIKDRKEQARGKAIIRAYLKNVQNDHISLDLCKKEKLWIIMMSISINLTAKLRNIIKINID